MTPSGAQGFKPQKIGHFSNALAIHLVDFPIYYIECISERHFIIAGGGGSSKTGVHNQINILELVPSGESCTAELILKYHTPPEIPDAIMNGSLMRDLPIVSTRLITGGMNPIIYTIDFNPQKRTFAIEDYEIIKEKRLKSEIKSVKYAPGKMYTGCIDGQLFVWDLGSKGNNFQNHIKAHSKEIDEIDVDVVNEQIVTLSRDEGRCVVWDSNSLKMSHEFKKEFINSTSGDINAVKYGYRSCRYAYDSSPDSTKNSRETFLLVACNPIAKKAVSKIYKISPKSFKISAVAQVAGDGIMAITVSSDGKYVGLGSRSGAVSILNVKKMKQIYHVDSAHHNAVTSLGFLDSKPESLDLTNSKTCALLSASIDRRIVLHRPRKRSLTASLIQVLIMVIMMYLIFSVLYKHFT